MISEISTGVKIPKEVKDILEMLEKAGFDAYVVGGCIRDLLLKKEPKDWDIATSAVPERIQKLFPDSVYENEFGTVGVKVQKSKIKNQNDNLKIENEKNKSEVEIVEITTFRKDIGYSDKRHPDKIVFAKIIEEDLARRDFTVNAMALQIKNEKIKIKNDSEKFKIIDLFGGQNDLKAKIIRAVGSPDERFGEDALRMLRAVRFAAQLGFNIETETSEAIRKNFSLIKHVAIERIRDEFEKIIMTENATWGVQTLYVLGLLKYIAPEILEGVGVSQNRHHIYNVWEHSLRSLDYAARKNYSLEIRLAALLHDVAKPKTKVGEGLEATFYQHEYVGAHMVKKILEGLRFPSEVVEHTVHLVRYHMFYYNAGEITEAGVRRFLARVGPENVDDLLKVREADRIGSGVPKAFPYKLRHLQFMIEKVKRDPISPKMLKINGNDVMKILSLEPGPVIGHILNALLEEVIDDPSRNTKAHLEKRTKELGKLSEKELLALRQSAEKRKDEYGASVEKEIKGKYRV